MVFKRGTTIIIDINISFEEDRKQNKRKTKLYFIQLK